MEALKMLISFAVLLGVVGVVLGASVLSIGKLGDTMTKCSGTGVNSESGTYNATGNQCQNSSGTYSTGAVNKTTEFEATLQSKTGLKTIGEQVPTIGIVTAMVVIIALLAAVLSYAAFFR